MDLIAKGVEAKGWTTGIVSDNCPSTTRDSRSFRNGSVVLQSRDWMSSPFPTRRKNSGHRCSWRNFRERSEQWFTTISRCHVGYLMFPIAQRAHGGGDEPQELIDNSLGSCLSNELLNICTQIRREYKDDAFRVLPMRIYCTGSNVNRSIPSPAHNWRLWCLCWFTWFTT